MSTPSVDELTTIVFDEVHIPSVRNGDKTLTARYGFDRGIELGDAVVLRDTSRQPFATATVTKVEINTIEEFVRNQYQGHQTYDSTEEFLEEMAGYYPKADLTEGTEITVVWFEIDKELNTD